MTGDVLHEVHNSFARSMATLAFLCSGTTEEDGGLLLYATPTPSPFPWNGALRISADTKPDVVVERARSFFDQVGHGYCLLALEGLDDDLINHLGESDDTSPEMIMTHSPDPLELPDGVELETVRTSEGREHFLGAVGEAFETLGEARSTWEACYPTTESLANPQAVAMVLYERGQPAAGGMYYRIDDVIEVLHIGTRPSFRRRGYGRMVTTALTIDGFEKGAHIASLQAEPMGYSTYQRIGYQTISNYHAYIRPADDSDGSTTSPTQSA